MKLKTKVKQLLANNPAMKSAEILRQLKISKTYGYTLAAQCRKELGIITKGRGTPRFKTRMQRGADTWTPIATVISDKPLLRDIVQTHHTDMVNHPAHYKVGGIETIDFIEAKQLSYNLGNVVKYIARADHKGDRKEDLLKARWYLNREIANIK